MGSDPFEGSPAVIVGGGKWVFRGESILDGDSEGLGLRDEAVEKSVVEEREGGFDAEATAMEVNENRKKLTLILILGFVWEVKASRDFGVEGDGNVFG